MFLVTNENMGLSLSMTKRESGGSKNVQICVIQFGNGPTFEAPKLG